jgi:penicillin G amidase
MKKLRKFLIGLLIVLALLIIGALLFVRYIAHRGLPDYSGTIELSGVNEEVRVIRDEFAIPHIYAKNEHDLYVAVGYVLAQDRLWQMDLLRRVTLGRLSEIFGEGYVDTDVLLRALRYTEKSERILSTMDSAQVSCLEAFASGVNQYIQQQGKNLPPEFTLLGYTPEPWKPVHSMNLIGYMSWDLKAGWSEMILDQVRAKVGDSLYRQLLPEVIKEKTLVYPLFKRDSLPVSLDKSLLSQSAVLEKLGLDIFQGSNNWAVSGSRSTSGKPILANDMHLTLNIPGIWYQMHQVIQGKLDVSGLVLPGAPYVIAGHNERIAWGMTNTYVDNVDFYEEKINASNANQYEYKGEWKDMQIKKEVIKVKGGKSFDREIRYTHRGPIVSGFKDIKDRVISMHWVGDEYSNEMRSVYLVNRAGNWDQFKEAMKTFMAASQNTVYADVDGNIGLYCCAGVPIRKREGIQFILPGWTDEYDWKGMLPFDLLPHSYNPPTGYVSSANNKTVGEDYPFHIGTWYSLPYRIDRIRELLSATDKHSPESFKAIQADHVSVLARQMTPGIIQYLGSFPDLDPAEKLALDIFKKWNFSMDKDLVAPSLFEKLYLELANNLFRDEIGDKIYATYGNDLNLLKFALNNIWQDLHLHGVTT